MSVKIMTDEKGIKVFRKDRQGKNGTFSTYFCKVSSKDKNDEWQGVFVDLRFKKGVEVNDKAVIQINNAFPVVDSYNGNNKMVWMVTDFDVVDGGSASQDVTDTWGNLDANDDDLPFAPPSRG